MGAVRQHGAMSRIELIGLATAPITTRELFASGDPGPIVAGLAQVPELVTPVLSFVAAALGPGAATTRQKELAILRTSALQGCQYCIHAHTGVALDAGLKEDEVRALRGEIALEDAFGDDAERALLGWIDAIAGATGPVLDATWSGARAHWAEHLLVELTVTIGATMLLNRFATAFELPSPPDRLEPAAPVNRSIAAGRSR